MTAPYTGRAPWSIVALIAAFAAVAGFLFGALLMSSAPPVVAPRDTVREALHDSIRSERVRDSVRLEAWADSVLRLRGDSLARMWLARPARRLPGRIDSILMLDTLRDTLRLPGAAVRADAIADSACTVRADSLAGELVQARYDAQECSDALQKRPTTCNGWTAFGLGFGAGVSVGAGVCVAVD